jgi:hypothetical protein
VVCCFPSFCHFYFLTQQLALGVHYQFAGKQKAARRQRNRSHSPDAKRQRAKNEERNLEL